MSDAAADPLREALEAAAGDRYAVVRLLGRGGMGAVYLARETALDRLVAIKVLPPGAPDAEERRERFRREARTAARLTHPGIVPLHTFGEGEGATYFVMGYVAGESLAARLKREGRLPAEEVRRLLGQVADALEYAHRQGVVHRDLKPDNILLDDDSGRALLADFGIAKAAGAAHTLTEKGSVIGTPAYMSPEQAGGGAVDARSDLYSLGVLGWQMLCGRLPFEGPSAREVLLQHLSREPPPLSLERPDTPPDLAAVVMRCLAKEPERRPPDARALRDALGVEGPSAGLPEALSEVEEKGFWLLLWWLAIAMIGELMYTWRTQVGPLAFVILALLAAFPIMLTLGLVGRAHTARVEGWPWRRVWRVAFHAPRSWAFWYPRALRREGDLWERLPSPVRRVRVMGTVGIAALFGVVPVIASLGAFIFDPAVNVLDVRTFKAAMVGVVAFFLAPAAVAAFRLAHWSRAQGLGSHDQARLLMEPTAGSAFWTRPHIAALLAPAGGTAPRGATELARAVARAAAGPSGAWKDEAGSLAEVARAAAEAVAQVEADLARLRRDADPEEQARLEARLLALGPERAAEASERRQMRDLLQRQLELVQALLARLREAEGRRDALLARLEALWRLVGRTGSAPPDLTEVRQALAALRLETEQALLGRSAAVAELPTLPR